jgi:serine/threonine-protein kinase
MDTDVDPLIGRVIDRYEVGELLGAGGMSRVYRARHVEIGRECAIKVLSGEMACHRRVVSRLQREAEATSRINHPNVVSVLDSGTTPAGVTYVVMELVIGRTLGALLASDGPLSPKRTRALARQIADGLQAAHALGFVHRDLKPSNVMITTTVAGEHVKILDFGLVATLPSEGQEETRITRVGHLIGTPPYMAPEMIRDVDSGERALNASSDLYSLGAVMFELLSGHPPFQGTTHDVLAHHLHASPPTLPDAGGLELVVYMLLAKTPEERPADALALVRLLDELGPLPDSPLGKKSKPSSVPRWAAAAAVALAIVLVFAFARSGGSQNDALVVRPVEARSAPVAQEIAHPAAPAQEIAPVKEAEEDRKAEAPPAKIHARRPKKTPKPAVESGTAESVIELHVDSVPQGAAVFVDGGLFGQTPLEVYTKNQRTLVTIKLDGFRERTVSWSPRSKGRAIFVKLDPAR